MQNECKQTVERKLCVIEIYLNIINNAFLYTLKTIREGSDTRSHKPNFKWNTQFGWPDVATKNVQKQSDISSKHLAIVKCINSRLQNVVGNTTRQYSHQSRMLPRQSSWQRVGEVRSLLGNTLVLSQSPIHRVTMTWFLHSYLRKLFWPPWCMARKCKHFAALTVRSLIWCRNKLILNLVFQFNLNNVRNIQQLSSQ